MKIGGLRRGKVKKVGDPTESGLHEHVRQAFPVVQRAWTDRDLDALSRLATDAYVARARPVIDELDHRLQVNRIEDAELRDVAVSATSQESTPKRMDAYLSFVLRDWLEDLRTTQVIRGDPGSLLSFLEHWGFVFDDARGWLLDRVSTVWEGDASLARRPLRELPPGRYTRAESPARWVEWDGSDWTP